MDELARQRLELHDRAIGRLEEQVVELRRQMNAALNQLGEWLASSEKKREQRQGEHASRLEHVERSIEDSIVASGLAYADHRRALDRSLEEIKVERRRKVQVLYSILAVETVMLVMLIGLIIGRWF